MRWVDLRVMYSQRRTFGGYRTDCSGYVAMAWQLRTPGITTWGHAPRSRTVSHVIGWDELLPGDAINKPQQHIMLFAGWMNSAHTSLCIMHENRTGTPANIGRRERRTLQSTGYSPVRFNSMPPGTSNEPVTGMTHPMCATTGVPFCVDRYRAARCVSGRLVEVGNFMAFESFCSMRGGAMHMVSVHCVDNPEDAPVVRDVCLPDGRRAHCYADGHIDDVTAAPPGMRCLYGGAPSARWASERCVTSERELPWAHDVCVDGQNLASCDASGMLGASRACPVGTACRGDTCVPIGAPTPPPMTPPPGPGGEPRREPESDRPTDDDAGADGGSGGGSGAPEDERMGWADASTEGGTLGECLRDAGGPPDPECDRLMDPDAGPTDAATEDTGVEGDSGAFLEDPGPQACSAAPGRRSGAGAALLGAVGALGLRRRRRRV